MGDIRLVRRNTLDKVLIYTLERLQEVEEENLKLAKATLDTLTKSVPSMEESLNILKGRLEQLKAEKK